MPSVASAPTRAWNGERDQCRRSVNRCREFEMFFGSRRPCGNEPVGTSEEKCIRRASRSIRGAKGLAYLHVSSSGVRAAGPQPISGAVAKVIACQRHRQTNRTPNVGANDKRRRKKRSLKMGRLLSTDLAHNLELKKGTVVWCSR